MIKSVLGRIPGGTMKVSFSAENFHSHRNLCAESITAFVDMGHEVEDCRVTKRRYPTLAALGEVWLAAAKTRCLQDRLGTAGERYRACKTLPGLHRAAARKRPLNFTRYGDESPHNLILAICARVSHPFVADVFYRTLWSGGRDGVAKLRELGVLRGKNRDYFPRD